MKHRGQWKKSLRPCPEGAGGDNGTGTGKMGRRLVAAGMALGMTVACGMPMNTYAASHDSVEDVSTNTATLEMGKILTSNHSGQFPKTLESVQYKLTAVKGFDNANESSGTSGKAIPSSEMPMPEVSSTANHQVTVSGTSAEITVGNFQNADSSLSSEENERDTGTQRKRTTSVKITYDKAGYYLYRLTEEGSTPKNIPGMTYDSHNYYVVVYVANRTDAKGNTVDGVYVHNITSYRNESGSDKYQPNLSDIAGVTDNSGNKASDNTESNLAKVGTSSSDDPDKLDAYRFWNNSNVQDLVLTTNVAGNLGDRSKAFEFTVALTGLESGASYSTKEAAAGTGATTSSPNALIRAMDGIVQGGTIVADAEGKARFTVQLKDDESLVINGLPASSGYQIEEAASDHIASFKISGTESSPVIAKDSDCNEDANLSLSTSEEVVDAEDGTVTVEFINERNLATVTGVREAVGPLALLVIAAVSLIASHRAPSGRDEETHRSIA